MFRNSFETSLIISLKKDNFRILAVLRKTFSIGKYSNFKFQKSGNFGSNSLWEIGGFGDQKMFRKSFETSLIISLKKDNLRILAVLRKTFSIGKYSNFKFQKSGNFGSNSLWEIGAFLKPRAKPR